jgi:hypothetical protein
MIVLICFTECAPASDVAALEGEEFIDRKNDIRNGAKHNKGEVQANQCQKVLDGIGDGRAELAIGRALSERVGRHEAR